MGALLDLLRVLRNVAAFAFVWVGAMLAISALVWLVIAILT